MINICSAINCPFANTHPTPPRSSGCTRYSISNHCHLMAHDLGFRDILKPNQYWLFASLKSDLTAVKQYNDDYIANDESSQRRLEMEKIMR